MPRTTEAMIDLMLYATRIMRLPQLHDAHWTAPIRMTVDPGWQILGQRYLDQLRVGPDGVGRRREGSAAGEQQ